jgi:RNA polymerase sigma factor (sigma-70 family)
MKSLKSLKIPAHLNEQEVLATIDVVVRKVSKTFSFGYFDVQDIEQEARIILLEALPSFDPSRARLEAFLTRVARTRLINFWRDKYQRNDPPCDDCHVAMQFSMSPPHDGAFCDKYLGWHERNRNRKAVMRPSDLSSIPDENEKSTAIESFTEEQAQYNELLEKIDMAIPVELRSAFLKLRAGENIPKTLKDRIQEIVTECLHDKNADH